MREQLAKAMPRHAKAKPSEWRFSEPKKTGAQTRTCNVTVRSGVNLGVFTAPG